MNWPRVKEILDAALDRPPDQWTAYVRQAADGDEEIAAEVLSLLEAYRDSDTFFGQSEDAAGMLFGSETSVVDPLVGQRIGAYRIADRLGTGGMGSVYLGRREDGVFEHDAAVKVIRPGMLDDDTIRRFHAERQILADLQHPGIAGVLDGGVLEDGRPYLVMEYVYGRPIDRYCDDEQLSIEDRLRLFRKVCAVVHFAHQNLVVHRDLKASNILVTADGSVKLLDFGVAKILDPERFAAPVPVTRTGMRAMTPEYASPEQVRGDAITTAADVYALGVLLYKLLSGRLPHEIDSRSIVGLAQAILEETPPPPSEADITDEAARARGLRRQSLTARLKGDLDVIVLKAVRKEPERRYGSVAQLSQDVFLHLRNLPVSARPDTIAYRTSRLLKRHPSASALVTILILTVVGFSAAMWMQQQETARERDRARQEEATARQVTDFLIGLFEQSNPYDRDPEVDSIDDVLERGTRRLAELDDQPAIQAEMYNVLGRVYNYRGRQEEAGRLLRSALTQQRALHEGPHPALADALADLGWYLMENGEYDEASEVLREGLNVYDELGADHDIGKASVLGHLGLVLYELGAYEEAEVHLRDALAIYEEDPDTRDRIIAIAANNLGMALKGQGRLAEAEVLYRRALDLRVQSLGADAPHTADSYNNLALLLRAQGKLDEAVPMMRRALELRKELLGPRHHRVATSLNGMAMLLVETGHPEEAPALLREALGILREQFGPDHMHYGANLNNLAYALEANGQHEAALDAFQGAVANFRKTLPPEHLRTALALVGLGRAHNELGRSSEAEPLLREGYRMLESIVGEAHWRTALAGIYLGAALAAQGRHDEARPLILDGYERVERERGSDDVRTRRAAAVLNAFRTADSG